ncbi:hypothetical protein, partial [Streptomyces chiangmaiensis]|uniref:hypothetical protein n=1 Tax=Streptomyces chiangmaiensis TaxID=766497 RepID=UPI0031EB1240
RPYHLNEDHKPSRDVTEKGSVVSSGLALTSKGCGKAGVTSPAVAASRRATLPCTNSIDVFVL